MDKSEHKLDAWVRMYEEQVRHARHHESLRTSSTNIAVVLSAAVLGLFATDLASSQRHMLALFLIVFNAYGFLMSLKHYERNKLHRAVSARYRNVISEATKFDSHVLNELRCDAHSEHEAKHWLMRHPRAHWMWCVPHFLLALLGAYLLWRQS